MNDEQLLRYSRHILLDDMGVDVQERLLGATALVVGAGGLGSPAGLYLAAAGLGRILLADDDSVDLTNLQRQILHRQDRVGQPKAESGRRSMLEINPGIEVEAIARRLDGEALADAVARADVVLDCCDNFATRQAVNRACVALGKPLVSGAAIRFEGQISVYFPGQGDSPCYRCLYDDGAGSDETCAQTGVVAPLLGIIGSVQALEALKVLLGIGTPLKGRLLVFDGLRMEWRTLRFARDPQCPTCSTPPRD